MHGDKRLCCVVFFVFYSLVCDSLATDSSMCSSCGAVCTESRDAVEGRAQLDPPTCSVQDRVFTHLLY